jgi:pyruvate formate lyase activating enzyme
MTGYVHSFYNGGMVDGPGIRSVVFLSGCPLRCKYCHNPDSWKKTSGNLMTVEEVLGEILKYKSYYSLSGGGVTISGGEPFNQPEFSREVLKACKEYGIHTAIDTSGYVKPETAADVLRYTDLMLLDIKSFNAEAYKNITGVELYKTLDVLRLSCDINLETWVRYVLVPGLTDNMDEIKSLAEFLRGFGNVKKVDVLPFHKEGEFKWESHNIPYELADTPIPSLEVLEEARKILNCVLQKR